MKLISKLIFRKISHPFTSSTDQILSYSNKHGKFSGLIFVGGLIFHDFSKKKVLPITLFSENDSPKFLNKKLFYLKKRQHYIDTIYKIIINLNNFTNISINIL